MARLARIVVPGVPHHVTQRGARRMRVFFSDEDYHQYKLILASLARRYALQTWAYCLMPNHVHLLVAPSSDTGLARPIGEAHRRYATQVNQREGWKGHLWQERFASFPMDAAHLHAAVRYVLLNPIRAGLVARAQDWPHSSAAAHLGFAEDPLVTLEPLSRLVDNWQEFLADREVGAEFPSLRHHTSTGRPLGTEKFVLDLEELLGRRLLKRRPGPSPTKR